VRVTDAFLRAVERRRVGPDQLAQAKGVAKTVKARELWEKVGHAAWACADPGIQFHTTINDWHTCPAMARSARRTRARNTCSWTTRPATWPR
jgi:ribonucleoside-diphosphate reductase alpha chain